MGQDSAGHDEVVLELLELGAVGILKVVMD